MALLYGHRPMMNRELKYLSPYEFTMYWEPVLLQYPRSLQEAAAAVWAGWALDRLVMRLGGAAAVQAASSCAAAHGAQARRWLGSARASPGQVKAVKGRQETLHRAPPRH